jgi:hypothetical protein
MSSDASRIEGTGVDDVASEIGVHVRGRWDALDLMKRLIPFYSFLVQETTDRWVVNARTPGCHGEPFADAVRAIEEWGAERGVTATVRVQAAPHGGSR